MTGTDDAAGAVEAWDGVDIPALLTVAQVGEDRFVGRFNQVNFYRSLFGGQVLGQSLAAAAATVEARALHSMHGYFLRPGAGDVPVEYAVERTRDGRSFTTRRVTGTQTDRRSGTLRRETIFQMECSFHAEEPGWEHQAPMPEVPPPEDLPDLVDVLRAAEPPLDPRLIRRIAGWQSMQTRPIVAEQAYLQQPDSRRRAWFRVPSARGHDNPALHLQILAWMSDFSISGAALVMHTTPLAGPHVQLASIDHAMWFHRPVRTDDWLLFETESPSASGAIGLSRGLIYDRAGRLVATVSQESLQRQITEQPG